MDLLYIIWVYNEKIKIYLIKTMGCGGSKGVEEKKEEPQPVQEENAENKPVENQEENKPAEGVEENKPAEEEPAA